MTIYDKGLLRAMKQAYKEDGYDVAVIENRILIRTDSWGIEILADAVPNSVKSLIVLHNGGLPRPDTAVRVCKSECSDAILEVVLGDMEDLSKACTENGGPVIKPTRLTMDGCRVWQTTKDLKVVLVDVEDQQILVGERFDAQLICGAIYGRNWFGQMYVRVQFIPPEDRLLLAHLSEVQWVSVELEE